MIPHSFPLCRPLLNKPLMLSTEAMLVNDKQKNLFTHNGQIRRVYGIFILGVNIKYGFCFAFLGSKVAYTGERVKG